jgi:hypothetical protein
LIKARQQSQGYEQAILKNAMLNWFSCSYMRIQENNEGDWLGRLLSKGKRA